MAAEQLTLGRAHGEAGSVCAPSKAVPEQQSHELCVGAKFKAVPFILY